MNGWIKLHRKFMKWEWYDKSNMVHLFLHLLLEANHDTEKWHGIQIERGQVLTGRKQLSQKTGISEQCIRTCLDRLKSTNEITIQSTKQYSVITINNYDRYQSYEKDNNQQINQEINFQSTNDQPTTNQQLTTNKKLKKLKNLKTKETNALYSDDFLKFWNAYKRHDGKAEAYKSFNKCKIDDIDFLVKAVEYYNQEYVKKNGNDLQYYPMPTTYLNQKRYLDYEDKQATPENIIDKVWRICGSDLDFYLEYPDIHEKPEGLTDEDITAYKQAKGIV
jgi:hypothetical protein